ncbi:MAG: pantetheine-phosphate adenylyltransferase [Candidatus Cloacimonadota bacterium]|nr:MAG: pantetheine-phosphate adenylyltransferase [Candidatus Cloacimonadota bacterium]
MIKAVYPGTFDPITKGHIDVTSRARKLFSKIIILIAHHNEKDPLFSVEERKKMIKESVREMKNVEVDSYDGLLVDYAKKKNIRVVIRGLRAISDFEYEFQMALMNRKISPEVETIFLVPHESYTYLSSSLIKEIISVGGDVSHFVPKVVKKFLKKKLNEND